MNLEEYVAVSGMPGIFKLVCQSKQWFGSW